MPFKFADLDRLYDKDQALKKEDVQVLQEWIKKQPHLPDIKEMQLLVFLHGCHYRLEPTKSTIDRYFTLKTHYGDLLNALTKDTLRKTLSVGFLSVLPKRTPEGYAVMWLKLIDLNTDNFNFAHIVTAANMVCTLHMHQHGYENGAVMIFDLKGFGLGHLARLNISALRWIIQYYQEAAPARLKGLHVINVVSFIDKLLGLVKPFMKPEIYDMITLHTDSIETLYQHIPKDCLPQEYGGGAPSLQKLSELNIANLEDNFDFFDWHDSQKVDESKRFGKQSDTSAIFGAEGTFKKLHYLPQQ